MLNLSARRLAICFAVLTGLAQAAPAAEILIVDAKSQPESLTVAPEGFDVAQTDDQGVSVSRFDHDSDAIAVGSERAWLVTLKAKPELAQPPSRFVNSGAPLVPRVAAQL